MSQTLSNHSHKSSLNGKRPLAAAPDEDMAYTHLPSNDRNDWYYPTYTTFDSDEEELQVATRNGNWGNKAEKGARWIRKGKKVAWGPAREEWETEDRARKRIKRLLPRSRSPSPPSLPHLRSPSPPLTAPYPPPNTQHASYASFVLDQAVAHSFRSELLTDLERATASLIEGEAATRRVLGRLWQVMGEDPDQEVAVTKREDADENEDDDMDERERRIARAPDLTEPMHKLFLTPFVDDGPTIFEPSHLGSPQMQLENMEKYIGALKELQDDGREYGERLEEIREGLGSLKAQRDTMWTKIRENAIRELKEMVKNSGL